MRRCLAPCCIRSWQMQSWFICPIIFYGPHVIHPTGEHSHHLDETIFQQLAYQRCLSWLFNCFLLGRHSCDSEDPWKLFCLYAHISVHIFPSHTGPPETSLLRTGLAVACSRTLWRHACSQQPWWLRQLVLQGLGASWRPGWGKVKGKLNFGIIQRSRELEHMEKEGVITHFRLQPRVVAENRLNTMAPGKECFFHILSHSWIPLPIYQCKGN